MQLLPYKLKQRLSYDSRDSSRPPKHRVLTMSFCKVPQALAIETRHGRPLH